MPIGEQLDAVAPCLLVGSHNYSPILIAVVPVLLPFGGSARIP